MCRLLLLITTLLLTVVTGKAQVYTSVEEMPEASYDVFYFISKRLVYPADAYEQRLEGRVAVRFVVDSTGSIVEPVVRRSISPSCDSEALRVISMMPKWKPGRQDGKAVNCYYLIPVHFDIDRTKKPWRKKK